MSSEVSGVVILSSNVLVLGKIREQFLLSLSRDDDDDHIFCLQVSSVRFGTACNVSGSSFKLYKQSTPRKPSTYKLLNLKCPKQSSKLFLTMRNQSSTKSQVQFIQKGGKSRKTMSSPPSGQCRLLILISHRYSSY